MTVKDQLPYGPASYALLPARRPWSVGDPDAADTLAHRGLAPTTDLAALRLAAREYATAEPSRRTT